MRTINQFSINQLYNKKHERTKYAKGTRAMQESRRKERISDRNPERERERGRKNSREERTHVNKCLFSRALSDLGHGSTLPFDATIPQQRSRNNDLIRVIRGFPANGSPSTKPRGGRSTGLIHEEGCKSLFFFILFLIFFFFSRFLLDQPVARLFFFTSLFLYFPFGFLLLLRLPLRASPPLRFRPTVSRWRSKSRILLSLSLPPFLSLFLNAETRYKRV